MTARAAKPNGKPSPHDKFLLSVRPYQLKLEACVGGIRARLFQQCGEHVKLISEDVLPESAISMLNTVVMALNSTTEAMMEARDWVFSYAKRTPATPFPFRQDSLPPARH